MATKKKTRRPAKRIARKRASGTIAKSAAARRHLSPKKARTAAIAKSTAKRSPIAKRNGAGLPKRKPVKKVRRVTHKWKKPARRGKRNPALGAKAMFEKFHGKPSTKFIDYKTAQHYHRHLADKGDLIYLKVLLPDDAPMEAVELRPRGVMCAMSEDGGQIYFIGGDQKLNLTKLGLASQLPKDHVVIGPVFEIEYLTEKKFDDFKPLNYFHPFGDEGGELPTLCYDVRSELMYLVGGSYQCRAEGIVD